MLIELQIRKGADSSTFFLPKKCRHIIKMLEYKYKFKSDVLKMLMKDLLYCTCQNIGMALAKLQYDCDQTKCYYRIVEN